MPETPPKRMASIAVVANPLAKNNDKVLLWQSGDTSYGLRVSPRSLLDFEIKASFGPRTAATVARPLTQPGQLVSFVYQDTVQVYGTTGEKVEDLQIELLSPVQNPISPTPLTGALAGCAKPGEDRAWLYFVA